MGYISCKHDPPRQTSTSNEYTILQLCKQRIGGIEVRDSTVTSAEPHLFLPIDKRQVCRCLSPAADIQFLQNVMNVVFDRAYFDHQVLGNLLVGVSLTD